MAITAAFEGLRRGRDLSGIAQSAGAHPHRDPCLRRVLSRDRSFHDRRRLLDTLRSRRRAAHGGNLASRAGRTLAEALSKIACGFRRRVAPRAAPHRAGRSPHVASLFRAAGPAIARLIARSLRRLDAGSGCLRGRLVRRRPRRAHQRSPTALERGLREESEARAGPVAWALPSVGLVIGRRIVGSGLGERAKRTWPTAPGEMTDGCAGSRAT